jgi:hypothetical protein
MESLEERKESVRKMMASAPEITMKGFEMIKEYYESINEWNQDNEDFHLYHLCKSIMRDKKLTDLLKKE